MTRDELYEALCDELTARGEEFRKPDVYGFVAAGWDAHTEDTIEEWVGAWQESTGFEVEQSCGTDGQALTYLTHHGHFIHLPAVFYYTPLLRKLLVIRRFSPLGS